MKANQSERLPRCKEFETIRVICERRHGLALHMSAFRGKADIPRSLCTVARERGEGSATANKILYS